MSVAADELAERIRALIGHRAGITQKRMFGGHGFMLHGNMVVGTTSKGDLLVRFDPAKADEAMGRPGAYQMMMGEKQMKGFLGVGSEGTDDPDLLSDWIDYAWRYVETMPAKP